MVRRQMPLSGYRVLDFSWVWSGPMVGSVLAELGAEVIKIEHGKKLDNSRLRGRPTIEGRSPEGPSIELVPYFHQTNHDKLSITINLKHPRGTELVHKLVAISDIVIENLSPGTMARNNLAYEDLRRLRPDIIMLSMSAAGQYGPLRDMRAYAPVLSAFGGLEGLVGYTSSESIGMLNFGYADPNATAHALVAVLAAVYDRERTGRGHYIDMSQLEALLAVLAEPLLEALFNHRDTQPRGNSHPFMSPHGIYPCAGDDTWVSIAVKSDTEWRALVEAMGRPAWALKPEYSDRYGRLMHRDQIDRHLAAWTRTQWRDELVDQLRRVGVAASPVLRVEEQWSYPQFLARSIRQMVKHPLLGEEYLYRVPWRLSKTQPTVERSAPLLGADNAYVFVQLLGLDPGEVERLQSEGVIA